MRLKVNLTPGNVKPLNNVTRIKGYGTFICAPELSGFTGGMGFYNASGGIDKTYYVSPALYELILLDMGIRDSLFSTLPVITFRHEMKEHFELSVISLLQYFKPSSPHNYVTYS
jgi:hypothetical protein